MAKYRIKQPIDADPYVEGMEDGYICYDIGSTVLNGQYYDKNEPLPKNCRVPAILTAQGPELVKDGDFVVTYTTGTKGVYSKEAFEYLYEPVE